VIAFWYDFFCQFYVCVSSAAAASNILENGSVEPDVDYSQIVSTCYIGAGGVFFL